MIRARHVQLGTLIALLVCALMATPAFADDLPPPPVPSENPGEGPGDTEAAPLDAAAQPAETAAVPDSPSEDDATVIESAAEGQVPPESASSEVAPGGLLEPLPQDTVVIVVSDGEAIPLASTEAAAIIAGGDPIWCPAGVATPVSGGSGCTSAYASLQDLINFLTLNQPGVDGTIWIEKTYDSSVHDPAVTAFTLDGIALPVMANYRLTVRGGWNGLGTKTIDTTDPSEINARLEILNWNNDVAVSDVEITGATTGANALAVTTSRKITLTRVRVGGNTSGGAYLNNTAGASDIVVSQSWFSNNSGGRGLAAYSNGAITLSGVTAEGNGTQGVLLANQTGAIPKNVTLTSGALAFNQNGDTGLMITSKGTVALKDVTAEGNGLYGVFIDNSYGLGKVTLTGTNIFAENSGNGTVILSNGAIAASNLVANANGGWGAWLANHTALVPSAVTLTGANQFKYNGGGLYVTSNGPISVANATATDNGTYAGAYLRNNYPGFASNVTMTGINTFDRNGGSGVDIVSHGAIALSNVTSNGNVDFGASLSNALATTAKAVTLTGTNSLSANGASGLYVVSTGAVTLNAVTADNNIGAGVYVSNTVGGTGSPQNVTLSTFVRASNNRDTGISVYTYGTITAANLTADDNGWGGFGHGASLDNADAVAARPIVVSGTNHFVWNMDSGLIARSQGAITASSVTAVWNGSIGAYLYNNLPGSSGAITLNGTSEFAYNGGQGLLAYSRGTITLKDLDSYANGGEGAYLDNAGSGATGNISVGTTRANWCNWFSDNYYSGLDVYSNGSVTLYNICASDNGDPGSSIPYGYGVYVYNATATTPKPVTLNGSNSFWGNYSGGLTIISRGAVKANNLSAGDTSVGSGAYIYNTIAGPGSPQTVTLTGENYFSNNPAGDGLTVLSYGAVALSRVSADNNGGNGIAVSNFLGSATLPRTVSLTGYATAHLNGGWGLWIESLGAITASNVSVGDNLSGGVYLRNDFLGASGDVKLTGDSNMAVWNSGYGFLVYTLGGISANNLYAGSNSVFGAMLDNSAAATAKPVSLTGTRNTFADNNASGLVVVTRGALTASNLLAVSNAGVGAQLDNTYGGPGAPQSVTLTGTNRFLGNDYSGLVVNTHGAIALSNTTASGNGWGGGGVGVFLDNYAGTTTPKTVTLSGVNVFEDNEGHGLYVVSWGAISASNLTARLNGSDGAWLHNQVGPPSLGGVTVSGTNIFSENGSDGLLVYSHGAITLNNVTAKWNGGDGAVLGTYGLSAPQKVTLTGVNQFIENGNFSTLSGSGLVVYADGVIAVSNLTASGNAATGAYLDNLSYYLSGLPGITLSGVNSFLGNTYEGLAFYSVGAVSLTKVTADNNGGTGIYGYTYGPITVSCASLTSNVYAGWWLDSPGTVTLKGVFAYGNAVNGILSGSGTLVTTRSCP